MANRFLNNIRINDEYTLPSADGSADQIITTDGAGQLSFVDQSTISAGNAEHVVIYAKNTHTASIAKGTPVYITGTVGATDTVTIAPADASNSAKMPAVGILDATLAVNDFGYVITGGFMDNITTDPIDGATPSSNDTVYVKSGGGLTLTKPTGASNLIQNIAKVGKVSGGNAGSLIVSSILRSNDVPNLTTGKIWVGSPTYTTESTVVHLDEGNSRMGINTTSPGTSLQVNGTGEIIRLNDTNATANPYLTFYQNGTRRSYVQHVDSGDNFSLGSEYGGIRFLTGTGGIETEKVRILSNGNFGIGTTSPAYKFVVSNGTQVGTFNPNSLGFMFLGSTSNHPLYLGVNDQTKMALLSNGNVGIGTTSPDVNLHVESTTSAQFKVGNGTQFVRLYADADEATILADGSVDMRFYTGGSEKMRINTSGNVGIGTTSPGAKLQVNGGVLLGSTYVQPSGSSWTTSNSQLILGGAHNTEFNDDNPGVKLLITGYNNDGTVLYPIYVEDENGLVDFWLKNRPSGSGLPTAYFGGNVGIGTTSPDYKLDVAGDVGIDGYIYHNGDDSRIGFEGNDAIRMYTANSVRLQINSNGNVGIGTTSPGDKLHVVGNIYLGTSNQTIYTTSTANVNLQTGTGAIKVLTDNGATIIADFQNAGSLQLAQYGSGTFTGTATQRLGVDSSGNVIEIPIGSGPVDGSGTANYVTKWTDADTIGNSIVYDNGTNVGIGTTSPSKKLHVAGSFKVTSESVFEGYIDVQNTIYHRENISVLNKLATNFVTWATRDTSGSDSVINLSNIGTITATGNVGIGTTSPSQKLHIADSGEIIRIETTSTNGYIAFRESTTARGFFGLGDNGAIFTGATTNSISLRSNSDLHFGGGGNSLQMTLDGTNVGIGTTSPNAKLEVKGSDSINAIKITDSGGGDSFKVTSHTTQGTYIQAYNASHAQTIMLDARSDSTSRHTYFNGGGNVGIGTTSPSHKLHVSGNALATNMYILDSIIHDGDTDTRVSFSTDEVGLSAAGIKQLTVTNDNVNITDTLSYNYPTANGEYNGEIVTFGSFSTANGTIAEGDVIVYTTAGVNSGWMRAQGNVTYSKGMLGIAMGTTPGAGILIKGFARNTVFTSGGLGSPLYLDPSNAGDTTNTAPGSTNNVVRIVGYMLNPTNDEIFFDPDKSWVQVS